VERAITALGIGEAFVTVLSPKGVPTPLAATRLLPPDSRMAPLTPAEIASVVAASPLATRYNQAVDRESAYEIITARLANAHAAAATAAAPAPGPATAASMGVLTPAQQQREIARQARALETARREAERERKAQERATRAAERQQQKTVETAIRTAGRVATSGAGQSLIRGLFGTIFGGGKR